MEQSGNDFHYEVADFLETNGWPTQRSPYYVDLATQKSREIDIIARRRYQLRDIFGHNQAEILIRLFIECKYLKPNVAVALNFVPKDVHAARDLAKNNNILRPGDEHFLGDRSQQFSPVHHYIDCEEVVKNWACGGSEDILYKGWEQALHAMIYYQHHQHEHIYAIDYPVIMVSSFKNVSRRDWINKSSSPVLEDFQIAVDYSYPIFSKTGEMPSVTKYFLIDVVSFQNLSSFLDKLQKNDTVILMERLRWDLEMKKCSQRAPSRPRY